jgi:2-polyprenyl-3-methyl-5-hydroxy-6-metoxy-1,4-benzoquinol methylase
VWRRRLRASSDENLFVTLHRRVEENGGGVGFLTVRKLGPELMDDPSLDRREHRLALTGLARLNRLARVGPMVWRELHKLTAGDPVSVLDLAAGSGDLAVSLARRAKRAGSAMRFTVSDLSPVACEAAAGRARAAGVEVGHAVLDAVRGPLPGGHDVVMCHLFLHHLGDASIVALLAKMKAAAGRGVLITDLARSPAGYALALSASRLVTRSRVVHVDAIRSVRAALTTGELRKLAREAGLENARIRRAWPERIILSCPA